MDVERWFLSLKPSERYGACEKFKIQFTFEISSELSEVRFSMTAQRFQVYADHCFSVGIIIRKHNSRATLLTSSHGALFEVNIKGLFQFSFMSQLCRAFRNVS